MEENNNTGIYLKNKLMSSNEVRFHNEFNEGTQNFYKEESVLIKWIIGHSGGLVKDEKMANGFLILLVVFLFIISLVFVSSGSFGKLDSFEKDYLDQGKSTELYDAELFSK